MNNAQRVTTEFLESIGYTKSRDSVWPEYSRMNDDGSVTRLLVAFDGRQTNVNTTKGKVKDVTR